jgi:hypothetical protein
VPLLPTGRAYLDRTDVTATVKGPAGDKKVRLVQTRGVGMLPNSLWVDENGEYFANAGLLSVVPAGFEGAIKTLRPLQQAFEQAQVDRISAAFLAPENRAPILFDNVQLFDADKGRFVSDQAVLVENGKIVRIGRAGSLRSAGGVRVVDGRGKTLASGPVGCSPPCRGRKPFDRKPGDRDYQLPQSRNSDRGCPAELGPAGRRAGC